MALPQMLHRIKQFKIGLQNHRKFRRMSNAQVYVGPMHVYTHLALTGVGLRECWYSGVLPLGSVAIKECWSWSFLKGCSSYEALV